MRAAILITIILGFGLSPHIQATGKSTATLEIRFNGIRSSKGIIAIGVNRSEKGWPDDPNTGYQFAKRDLKNGVLVAKITDLAYGTYAISVLDDENSNLEMDMFLGIPREGFGFSLNPPVKFSAPKFEDCSFRIEQPYQAITIDLRYIKK